MVPLHKNFSLGMKKVFPLFVGVIPFGIAYGISAKAVGISALKTISMSLLVFAGAAQFISVELVKNKGYALTIVVMCLVVNLRHILMSLSLKPYLEKYPRFLKMLIAFGIHDESYVTTIAHFKKTETGSISFLAGASLLMYSGWVGGSAAGYFLCSAIGDPFKWGLDFTMVVTFICMLVPQVNSREILLVVLISGIVSVLIALTVSSAINIIAATFIGALAGYIITGKKK